MNTIPPPRRGIRYHAESPHRITPMRNRTAETGRGEKR